MFLLNFSLLEIKGISVQSNLEYRIATTASATLHHPADLLKKELISKFQPDLPSLYITMEGVESWLQIKD